MFIKHFLVVELNFKKLIATRPLNFKVVQIKGQDNLMWLIYCTTLIHKETFPSTFPPMIEKHPNGVLGEAGELSSTIRNDAYKDQLLSHNMLT